MFDLPGLDYTFWLFFCPADVLLFDAAQAKCRPIDAMEQLAGETSEFSRIWQPRYRSRGHADTWAGSGSGGGEGTAARQMVKQGHGKIINVASLLAHQGGVIVPGYTASKHGVVGFTKAMANELAPKGVNVNSITPGYMHTDLTDPLVDNPEFGIEARIPMGRWGTPKDLQGACLLLASEAGDYIHGADVAVDGGWLAW